MSSPKYRKCAFREWLIQAWKSGHTKLSIRGHIHYSSCHPCQMSNWRFGRVCAEFEFDSVQCVTCTSFLPMCKLHFAGCQMKAKLSDLQTIRLCNSFVCGNTKLLYILSPCKHTKNLYQIMAENINIQEIHTKWPPFH